MKLAVINFSGNVGKTTVARHLLAPRIRGCQFVSVESINADESEPLTIRGRQSRSCRSTCRRSTTWWLTSGRATSKTCSR